MATLELADGEGCRLEDAIKGLEMLRWWEVKAETAADYKAKAAKKWPEATAFESR